MTQLQMVQKAVDIAKTDSRFVNDKQNQVECLFQILRPKVKNNLKSKLSLINDIKQCLEPA